MSGNRPSDTATPEAMATLLQQIYRQEVLKPESTFLLLGIMQRCETGEGHWSTKAWWR